MASSSSYSSLPPSSSLMTSSPSPSKSSSPWDSRLSEPLTRKPHPMPHTPSYYAKCMLGGILSCGLTHTAVTPLDVVKCKMQVYPERYRGLLPGLKKVVSEESVGGLKLGWAPTFLGYSMQGLFKFGLYEYFKDLYGNLLGEEVTAKQKGAVWLAASASAEFFADVALCPMEMVKVKMQTSPAGTWPSSFLPALAKMNQQKRETKFPFGSVVPLWSRQIPYTMAKFYFFEKVVQLFYDKVFTKPKDSYRRTTQLGITFASGQTKKCQSQKKHPHACKTEEEEERSYRKQEKKESKEIECAKGLRKERRERERRKDTLRLICLCVDGED